ncbi:MAG: hypothetical protein WC600_15915 [Desulfobaccales bacterium]
MEMHPVYLFLDPYLIWFYRLTGHAALNFLLGTFVLASLAFLVGECTSNLAMSLVRRHLGRTADEAKKYQDLSMEALKTGDRPAYEATNKLANDAFGQSFFMQLTLSATFFWPIFFALGWMQYRFLEMEFPIPGTNWSLGYIGGFILIYIAAYLILKRLPWIRRIKAWCGAVGHQAQGQEST